MQPRLKDIARTLGVSTATVSNALTGKGRVSKPVADRVLAEAMRQGYRPGGPGRALRTGHSGVIGLVLPDLANPLFPRMAQALERAAGAAGYGILIADSHGDSAAQADAIRRLRARGADGLIVVPRRGTDLGDVIGPLVVIDTPSTPGNTVSADHHGGGALVAGHLAGLGHERVLFVGESAASTVQRARMAGMASVTAPHFVVWLEKTGPTPAVAAARNGTTAIAATSDLVALKVLTALQAAGLSVPRDVSLTGFDDLVFSAALHPALTTVVADQSAIATHAIATLAALIDGGDPPAPAAIPMQLVTRASTAQPKPTQQESEQCRNA